MHSYIPSLGPVVVEDYNINIVILTGSRAWCCSVVYMYRYIDGGGMEEFYAVPRIPFDFLY